MSLEELKKELESENQGRVREILDRARKEAKEILDKAEGQARELEEKAGRELETEKSDMERREISQQKLAAKQSLFELKKKLMEQVFSEAELQVLKMPKSDRAKALKYLVGLARKSMEVSTVYCNRDDMKQLREVESGEIKMLGGLIAENKEGTVREDYSFETLLVQVRQEEAQELAKRLFG
ncbi:hypothetical protein J4475_03465 [Candidatus Woesearchaeota archaeon]|nr:hypothetical protein [Candidatus Woesearchaeota archaeon]